MRLKEFIKEAGRNSSSEFDTPADAKPAETPDWLKKVGKYLGDKIGLKEPVALPDYTASKQQDAAAKSNYRGIDPIQRQSLGMAPATQQEIDAYMKAKPAVVGGLTDRNGNPIASGNEVERAARAAAPRRSADFDVDSYAGAPDAKAVGDRFYTPRELGFQPGGTMPAAAAPAAAKSDAEIAAAGNLIKTPREQGNYLNKEFDDRSFDRSPVAPGGSEAPRTKVAAPSSATVQGGAAGADSRLSKAPPVAVAQPISTTTIKTEPIAAVGGDQTAAKVDGENSEQDDAALAKLKKHAGLGDTVAAAEPPVAVKDPLAAVDSGSLGRPANAGVAAGAPASTSDPEEFIRDKSDDKFDRQGRKKTQNKEPVPVQPPEVKKKPTVGGDNKRISGNTIAPEIVIPPGTPGTMLPGVKDSEGRQVWRRPDSSEMGWDTKTQRWYPISIFNRKFNSAPQGSQGSEPAPARSSILNRFKTVDAVDAEIKRFLDKGYDMRLPANQQYVNNLTDRRAELAKVRESSDISRMRLLAGLIKD